MGELAASKNFLRYEAIRAQKLNYLAIDGDTHRYDQWINKGLNHYLQKEDLSLAEFNNLAIFLHEKQKTGKAINILTDLESEFRELESSVTDRRHSYVSQNLSEIQAQDVSESDLSLEEKKDPCESELIEPIFIGGSGRCGTTFFQAVLDAHSDICSFGEARFSSSAFFVAFCLNFHKLEGKCRPEFLRDLKTFLLTSLYTAPTYKGPGGSTSAPITQKRWGLCNWFSKEEIKTRLPILNRLMKGETKNEVCRIVGEFVRSLFSHLAKKQNAKVWVEKTPQNLRRLDILREFSSDLKFLHLFRDGRDVVSSTVNKRGPDVLEKTNNFGFTDTYWGDQLCHGFFHMRELRPEQYQHIRYSQFLEHPEETLRDIVDFIGVPFESEMLDFEFRTGSVGRFKDELNERCLQHIEKKYGGLLEILGFECLNKEFAGLANEPFKTLVDNPDELRSIDRVLIHAGAQSSGQRVDDKYSSLNEIIENYVSCNNLLKCQKKQLEMYTVSSKYEL